MVLQIQTIIKNFTRNEQPHILQEDFDLEGKSAFSFKTRIQDVLKNRED